AFQDSSSTPSAVPTKRRPAQSHAAQRKPRSKRVSRCQMPERFIKSMLPPSNEKRLSCAAVLCCSQKQFHYDGRRQLQPLVRQTRDDTEQSPTEIRQELWPSVRQGIP